MTNRLSIILIITDSQRGFFMPARSSHGSSHRIVRTACAFFFLTGLIAAHTATAATPVPASFDCKRAERTIDRFLCGHAVLRWQDLALSRSYAAARNTGNTAQREALLDSQRRWLKERDERCIGTHTLKELKSQGKLANEAYQCLLDSYLKRRQALLGTAPAWVAANRLATPLQDIARARPDWQGQADRTVLGASLSPDARQLALVLPAEDDSDVLRAGQIWLYRVGAAKGLAVTSKPSGRVPGADDEMLNLRALAWHEGTLYAQVWLWEGAKDNNHTRATYAASATTVRRVTNLAPAVQALLDAAANVSGDTNLAIFPDDEQDAIMPTSSWLNREHLVWVADRGHGTVELMTQARTPDARRFLVSWGDGRLMGAVFDPQASLLLYPDETGLKLMDLATHQVRDILGTTAESRPLAMVSAAGKISLTWLEPKTAGSRTPATKDDQPFDIYTATLLPKKD